MDSYSKHPLHRGGSYVSPNFAFLATIRNINVLNFKYFAFFNIPYACFGNGFFYSFDGGAWDYHIMDRVDLKFKQPFNNDF